MTRIVLHCSISLDGFATGPAGDLTRLHDWMFSLDEGSGTSVASALTREFHASKAIIFGRRTWDSGQEPWGEDDVFSAPVFVLTHELLQPVERNGTVFTFVGNLHEAVRRASAVTGGGDVWVANRGFSSAENRRELRRGGGHYIIGEELRSGSAEATNAKAATSTSGTTCRSKRCGSPRTSGS